MCGIIGIWSPSSEEGLESLLLGLRYLHRRGPEGRGAGVVNPHTGAMGCDKIGKLDEIAEFEKRVVTLATTLRATIFLGQTRYITDARSDNAQHRKDNTQPVHLPFDGFQGLTDEGLGVHNGNVMRKRELEAQIKPLHPSPTDVDSRFIIELFMQKRREYGNEWLAGEFILKELYRLDGAASIIFSGGRNLVAFRDPQGYRPLEFGTIKGSKILVSETGFFEEAAAQFGRDEVKYEHSIQPGEMIVIDKKGNIETKVLASALNLGGIFRPCGFEDIYVKAHNSRDNSGQKSVWDMRNKNGKALASFYKEKLSTIDFVVPVVKSGLLYAQGFAAESGITYGPFIAKPFLYENERFFLDVKTKPKHAYVIDPTVKGKNLAIIDDSIQRGTTLIKLYASLKDAEAERIAFFIAWPATFFGCNYGVDTKNEELIAYELIKRNIVHYTPGSPLQYDVHQVNEKITELLRSKVCEKYGEKYGYADDLEVFYAPLEVSAAQQTTNTYCFDCVGGTMPTRRLPILP